MRKVRTGLFSTFDDEVVDHDSNEPVCTGDDKRWLMKCGQSGIDTCNDALTSGFFVTRRTCSCCSI